MQTHSNKSDSIWRQELKHQLKMNFSKFKDQNNLENSFNNGERFIRANSLHDKFKDFGFSNLGDLIVWLTGCEKPFMYD
ncbi:hypothetical protein AWW72_14870 [Acinetobacter sp. NRRL B-65365]|uniref:hypothetical protein n=1 Tax=Acinetobacter sp. NRRL B-65365 TaxID=1785092 RepID=UPI0007A0C774|nr:hypothetical protein [Acinetobacter sp. NRRL B-65365]KYQ83278.1 hypothetical protein AWW72_14870 [Acinetobacter sp. NRRL B-65365]